MSESSVARQKNPCVLYHRPKEAVKRSRNHLFRNLFLDPKNALQLYKILHPEDVEVKEQDISYLTITREIVSGIRNDLGMYISGKYIILIEAQTTWTVNILIRMFIYLAETWKNYIIKNELDVFSSRPLELPVPELYVVYTGRRKKRPALLKLSEHIFHGVCKNVELSIQMIYNEKKKGDILNQYVLFTEKVDYFYKRYGKTKEAAQKLIAYCVKHDILKDYLLSRKEEVTSMLDVIFDDTIHKKRLQEEAEAKGEAKGKEENAREIAFRLRRMDYPVELIAEIVDVPIAKVETWFSAQQMNK